MFFARFARDTQANTAIIFAIAAPALIAIAGAATMLAYEVSTKSALQAALDAGALAGTALTAEASDADRIKAAKAAFYANFGGTAELATGKSDYVVATSDLTMKFSVSNWEVSGEAVATIDNPFGGIIGERKLKVRAGGAAAKMESEPICVLGLNPDHDATIDMTGQPTLTAHKCAVQANSRNGAGMSQKGKPMLKAKIIGTTGGFSGSGYEPPPIKGTIPVADPFKSLPFPDYGGCDYKDLKISGSTEVLKPGVYCGGIRIVAGGSAILKSGIYIIKDGPLWINGGGFIRGNEVLIAFTGSKATLYMEGSSTLDLTSPVSGTYANMQFMQETGTGGDDLYFSVIGNNNFKVDGAIYLPTLDVWFGGGTIADINSPGYAIVADKVWLQDQSVMDVTHENKRHVEVARGSGVRYGARLIR